MKHKERLKIAEEIKEKIVSKHKDDTISIGIFGSVSRNEDDEFSGLEMIVITKENGFFRHYIINDRVVLVLGIPFESALNMVRNVDVEWPLKPGYLLHQKVIYGDKSVAKKFRDEVRHIKERDFIEAAKRQIIWMRENLNKIKGANKAKSRGKMLFSLTYFTIQANLLVGLLNKHIYKRQGFGALEDVKDFKKLPRNYYILMKKLYESTDLGKIARTAEELYNNCAEFLGKFKDN